MICASQEPLGAEYVDVVRNSVAERWIDRYPNLGKGGGAFSGGSKGTYPFISMVYQDDFRSVSVLTHEFGHSLHSYYAWQTQSQIYCDYSNFTAINGRTAGGSSVYTVQAGDTLARLAQGLWGDASLWYRIADANGLMGVSPDSALTAGMKITLP